MATVRVGEFEWDDAKARANVRKHLGRLLVVVFAERVAGGIIRIISARRATKHERRAYAEGN